MRLYDYAKVIRSKNAGPFTLTIDILLDEQEKFENVIMELNARRDELAKLYVQKLKMFNLAA